MAVRDNSPSIAGFVAESSSNDAIAVRRRAQVAQIWNESLRFRDANELALQRRARRVALALMALSSLVSVAGLYGVWMLCHGLM